MHFTDLCAESVFCVCFIFFVLRFFFLSDSPPPSPLFKFHSPANVLFRIHPPPINKSSFLCHLISDAASVYVHLCRRACAICAFGARRRSGADGRRASSITGMEIARDVCSENGILRDIYQNDEAHRGLKYLSTHIGNMHTHTHGATFLGHFH